jgi:2-octaprenyl-6-methoxyphenol hydroxylase
VNTSATSSTDSDYDLIIVGGGLVGISLALSLARHKLRIALIETASYQSEQPPGYDDRAIALSFGSRRIFEGMGLWPQLEHKVSAIQRIHVSEQGRFGFTRLNAEEEGVDALGYVITARDLGLTLFGHLQNLLQDASPNQNLTLLCPATVTQVALADGQAGVTHLPCAAG